MEEINKFFWNTNITHRVIFHLFSLISEGLQEIISDYLKEDIFK